MRSVRPPLESLAPPGARWVASYRLERDAAGSWGAEAAPPGGPVAANVVAWLVPSFEEAALRLETSPVRSRASSCRAWHAAAIEVTRELVWLLAADLAGAAAGDAGLALPGLVVTFRSPEAHDVLALDLDARLRVPTGGPAALLALVYAAGAPGAALMVGAAADLLPSAACGACVPCRRAAAHAG